MINIYLYLVHLGAVDNFLKLSPDVVEDYGIPYDYGSVLHYSAYAFSIDPKVKTIVSKVSDHYSHKCSLCLSLSLNTLLDY